MVARNFSVWDLGACSMALKVCMLLDVTNLVNMI